MTKILIFVGMPGSGKTDAVLEAQDRGLRVYNIGDEVRDVAARCEIDPAHIGAFADIRRVVMGPDVWAKAIISKIDSDGPDGTIVIDGVRSMPELRAIKERFTDCVLIAILTHRASRLRRILDRAREDDSKNADEFDERDDAELRRGQGDVIAMADIMIANDEGEEAFLMEVNDVLSEVLK